MNSRKTRNFMASENKYAVLEIYTFHLFSVGLVFSYLLSASNVSAIIAYGTRSKQVAE